jgi:acid stress-induced BolA-like protein IbaG/YrbA
MVTPNEIKEWIEQGMKCDSVQVAGDGRHFDAVIVSSLFEGKSMIEQHRLVYDSLGDHMISDIHALSLKTIKPTTEVK